MRLGKEQSAAFAPATIGNVCIGFDVLGMAIDGAGDQVELKRRSDSKVIIKAIRGVVQDLPIRAEENTAGAALLALQNGEKLKFGFDVWITKGIPLGSGMGGSAASAVAAVVAAMPLLAKKLSFEKQFSYALAGEKIASGAAHPDNVAPCLVGGVTFASLHFSPPVHRLPFPKALGWVLVHPNVKVETKQARALLEKTVPMEKFVHQTANLTAFLAGLYKKDLVLLRQGFNDVIIEPQRARLIPGFLGIKAQVLKQKGVIGFSISGSGPSVFAWVESKKQAARVAQVIQSEFKLLKIPSEVYIGQGAAKGARLVPWHRSR
jgi:homoserine kinase